MQFNRLRFNPSKTEFLWCTTTRRMHYANLKPIHTGDRNISPSASVRSLCIMMDGDFSVTTRVKKRVRSCSYSLRQIRAYSTISDKEAAKMLVSRFICSRINYCNSVSAGLPRSTTSPLTRSHMLRFAWYLVAANTTTQHLYSEKSCTGCSLHGEWCKSFV